MKSKGTIKAGVYVINKSKRDRGELHFLGVCGKSLHMSLWLMCSVVSVCGVYLRVCVCVSHVHLLTKKQEGDSGVVSVLPSTLFP